MLFLNQKAELRRTYTQSDLETFSQISGTSGGTNVPEPLIASLFSYLLGVELPGAGTNYLKQELVFRNPAQINTEITAVVEVTRLRPEKRIIDLSTTATTSEGTLICEGRALVKATRPQPLV